MNAEEFSDLVQVLREQTLGMTDTEAVSIIDGFLGDHPSLLECKVREWYLKYC